MKQEIIITRMEVRNKNMKVLIFIFLFLGITNSVAQNNINVQISRYVSNNEEYVKVTIINNNPSDIYLHNMGKWADYYEGYVSTPPSFFKFIGNPNSSNKKESGRVTLSQKITQFSPEKQYNIFCIKADTIYLESYKVFGEDVLVLRVFHNMFRSFVHSLRLEAHLRYYYVGTKKSYNQSFVSNDITI